MRIDNSQADKWRHCPLGERERYHEVYPGSELVGIEPASDEADSRAFGHRMHALLGNGGPPLADAQLEAEAQATFAAYRAHYPVEPFEIVAQEQTREVPLCERHTLVVKLDKLVRNCHGELQVFDTKTQRRNSANNDPEHWAARPQVALYIYAARLLYPSERVSDEIILDLIRRQSPKGNAGPEFHRDTPRRTPEQIAEAVRDIIWVTDRIEAGDWPAFRCNCKVGRWKCDYFELHNSPGAARGDLLRRYFKPAEPYLEV